MKAILVHLAAAAFCILSTLFILGGNKTDSSDRLLIVGLFVMTQIPAGLICFENDFYKQKPKL